MATTIIRVVFLSTLCIFGLSFFLKISSFAKIDLASPKSAHHTHNSILESPPNSRSFQCRANRAGHIPLLPAQSDFPRVLKDYILWHRKQRQCLLNQTCSSTQKIHILVSYCPTGRYCLGLGDRMRGVYYTFLLAIATQRIFFLEWSPIPFDITSAMIPASIDWRVPDILPPVSEWPTMYWWQCRVAPTCPESESGPSDLRSMPLPNNSGEINLLTDNIASRLAEYPLLSLLTRFNSKATYYLLKNPFLKEMFKPLSVGKHYVFAERESMRSLFRPSIETRYRMAQVSFGVNERYLAAHVRTGEETFEDGLDRFRDFSSSSPQAIGARIIRCTNLIADRDSKRRLFVASDSARLKNRLHTLGYDSDVEVHSVGNESILHVSKLWYKNPDDILFRCRRYLEIFVDIFMLANADHIIVLIDSHFSCLARALSRNAAITLLGEGTDEENCIPSSQRNLSRATIPKRPNLTC